MIVKNRAVHAILNNDLKYHDIRKEYTSKLGIFITDFLPLDHVLVLTLSFDAL